MNPNEYYQEKITEVSRELDSLKRKALLISMLRLSVFLTTWGMVYFFIGKTALAAGTIIVGMGTFLLLVSKYTDLKSNIAYLNQLRTINEIELKVLKGDFSDIPDGSKYIFEDHHYNQDIDLFGQGSLFQLINRTETKKGEELLASWLNENSIDNIRIKQIANQELSNKVKFRQHFKATAAIVEGGNDSQPILNWFASYSPYFPKFSRYLPIPFSICSIGLIGAYIFNLIPGAYLLLWLLIGMTIVGRFVKKTTDLYNKSTQAQNTLNQYSKLLLAIENERFDSEILKARSSKIYSKNFHASQKLKNLSTSINYLGNRNNIFLTPIINGFFLWDIIFGNKIEAWIDENKAHVQEWFDVIEFFDAQNSMSNLAFNNPEYIYPEITTDNRNTLKAEELGHPLLRKDKLVPNSVSINTEDFFIITGANMAGKSTFLRTVALNLVMANCGLPIWAKSYSYKPTKLISSMRTSDSLQNDESYFFSELKRLKFIVDEMKNDEYFIILDEILKGTNSKDKAEGSQKFVEKLVSSNSTGLIATHDLSLCELSKKLSEIKNHYFDAQIIDDELFFDYKFKDGICQNMNASFLLRKMEIV
ncbi:MAG: DNA mismatch repair protein MutS [Crocinitomicaceae bacterium]|nr:DNA mismatch repair protein MutS [Crocinitomicaceae bacterium]